MISKKISLFAFVPVLHKGYVDFFSGKEGDICLFGKDIIDMYVHLTRDLRLIDPGTLATGLSAVFPGRNVRVIGVEDLKSWDYDLTVMPDDEVCRDLASKFLSDRQVEFTSVFLRWNKVITFTEFEIPANRIISSDQAHKEMMAEAMKEREKSSDWWRQIGALVVKDGKVLYKVHNHHLPTDFHLSVNGDPRSNFDAGQHTDIYTSIHAEAEAVAMAAMNGVSLKGASLYSTTFPCPNCARLIGTAGVKTVYYSKGYSLLDAEKILNHFGVEIVMIKEDK